jgi:hypothetical protein
LQRFQRITGKSSNIARLFQTLNRLSDSAKTAKFPILQLQNLPQIVQIQSEESENSPFSPFRFRRFSPQVRAKLAKRHLFTLNRLPLPNLTTFASFPLNKMGKLGAIGISWFILYWL